MLPALTARQVLGGQRVWATRLLWHRSNPPGTPSQTKEAARDKQTQVEGTYAKKPFIDIVRARPRPTVHTAPVSCMGR